MQLENRFHRNCLHPLHRLPNEALAIIFEIAGCCDLNSSQPLTRRAPLNISKVSRLWRAIALATPRLWTQFDPLNAAIAPLFLARSKSALLDIEVACPEWRRMGEYGTTAVAIYIRHITRIPQFMRPLRPQMHRWRSVLLVGPELKRSELEACLNAPAPMLQSFCASISSHCFYVGPVSNEARTPTDPIFAGHTPRLRSLTLEGICLPLTYSIFTGLTYLHLESLRYHRSRPEQFISNLAACPQLESLKLKNVYFTGTPAPAIPSTPVHVPHLWEMEFEDLHEDFLHRLLASIHVPPTLAFEISMTIIEPEKLPRNSTTMDNLQNVALASELEISIIDDSGICFITGNTEEQEQSFEFKVNNEGLRPFLPYLAMCLPLKNLQELTLRELGSLLTPDAFNEVLRYLPSITKLWMFGCDAEMMEMLIITGDANPCPLLESLALDGSDITDTTLIAIVESRVVKEKFDADDSEDEDDDVLSHISVHDCPHIDLETIRRLREFDIAVDYWGKEN